MAQSTSRRTTSHSGSARLSLSVGKNGPSPNPSSNRHPLRQDWSISYVHRPPGAKGIDYEKEIRKVATFGSIESFLHLYSHLTPPNELPPVTDVLVFVSRIGRPGVWEEMRDGGKFTLRLVHGITPLLYESLLLSLIGDQFEESDNVVGCVLSVRQTEDILSVWVEEEGDGVRSGALKEKILSLLGLPSSSMCEYRANRALLDAASKPIYTPTTTNNNGNSHHVNTSTHAVPMSDDREHQHHQHHNHRHERRERTGTGTGEHERERWNGHSHRERRAPAPSNTGTGAGAAAGGAGGGSIW